jgi:hypothetical protein
MPFQFRKEAIEEDLNSNFPSQGQGNPPLYYSLSEVVVPTYSINTVAEGSSLPQNLQTAWDFSTGHATVTNTATTVVTNTGFWQVDLNYSAAVDTVAREGRVYINDGLTDKIIWEINVQTSSSRTAVVAGENKFIVFLRSGDSLVARSLTSALTIDIWYRQIAALNGELTNPLGFSVA